MIAIYTLLAIVNAPIIASDADNVWEILILVNVPSYLVLYAAVTVWALQRKHRRLWWLLPMLIPYGWLIYVLLENRRQPVKTE